MEENFAAEEAVADGLLFRDNKANDMWDQYVACLLLGKRLIIKEKIYSIK